MHWSLATVTLVVIVAVMTPWLAPAVSQSSAPAADPRDYPRTYHLYGSGPVDELARYDMVVGWSWFDISGLRARNPNGIFLLTPALTSPSGREFVYVTSPGAAETWPGGIDTYAGGVNLGSIRAVDPAWDLLHNADGSQASPAGYSWMKGWNLADPKGKGTPGLVAKVFTYAAKNNGLYSAGWDGVHSDNWIYSSIGASWFYGPNLDTDRDGKVDDMTAVRRNWANGLTNLGNSVRSYLPGKIVGGNGAWYRPEDYTGSDPEGWLKASNYTLVEMMEKFAYTSPESFLALTRRWLDYPDPGGQARYMAVYQSALDSSGTPLPSSPNPNDPSTMLRADVMKSMRWGLSLSLMTDVYYEIMLGGSHMTRWWYDEYDGGEGVRRRGYLGQPVGTSMRLGSGLYRRDFQNGIALNNSSSAAQTVQLGGVFKKLRGTQNPGLNDGSSVTSVTLPAHDGIILLGAGSPFPTSPPPPRDLAAGKPATASSDRGAPFTAAMAVDDNLSTRWSAAWRDGEWWQVDLGSSSKVARLTIDWEDAFCSRYQIRTSLDGVSFATAAETGATGAGPKTTTFAARDARYLRILCVTRGTQWGTSFYGVEVYGPSEPEGSPAPSPPPSAPPSSPPDARDLAAGKPATASSNRGSPFTAAMAVDGNPSTRWSADWRDGEWWQVDLGSAARVATVTVDWEDAYCSSYQILTSLDGVSFDTVAEAGATAAGPKTTTFAARDARYVRILCVTRGTQRGASFFAAQLYGPTAP